MFKDEILDSIKNITKNYKVYLVGGYLRNYFLKNIISKDRDLVVEEGALELSSKIAQNLGGTLIELDSENQIYRVVLPDKKNFFDISKALFNDISKDSLRRDFTINSIYYDLNKKEIFDPLGGLDDIKNKIIKTFDFSNLKDDPLRFLRMYRFYSDTGFAIDKNLEDYAKKNFHLINNVAKERINCEILHIFEGEFLVSTLLRMFDDGTLEMVFPFVKEIKKIPPNSHHHLDLIHHSIETVNNIKTNKPLLKIAAFYHDIGKPSTWTIEKTGRHRFIGHDIKGGEIVKKELAELKFSNKQISYISKMVKYHIYPAALANSDEPTDKAYARFFRKLGKDTPDVIELSKADRLSARGAAVSDEMVKKALEHLDNLLELYKKHKNTIENPKSLLDGFEIMETLNLKPSKRVGEITEILIENQLLGKIKTKEEAIDFIKKIKPLKP